MEVRRKAVKIALNMVTSRNVQEVVLFLKKQLTKTLEEDYEKVRIPVQYSTLILILIVRPSRMWNTDSS
jgi:hypothetical protein